jgi:RNA polymerase sigma-70 factor (ECF subfamily)
LSSRQGSDEHRRIVDDLTGLLDAARGGNRSAFASFVRRTQVDVWRFCAHLVDADAVEDVTQDTYLRAAKALRSYRGDGSALSWLLSIARRACADEVRRRRRRRALHARIEAQPVEEVLASRSGESELTMLIDSLDEDRRVAFVLTQVLGLSYDDAAQTCGCPVGTIRSRVARARADLVDKIRAAGNQTAAADDL